MPKKSRKLKKPLESLDLTEISVPDHRPETKILQDLEKICASLGYIHALSFLCWRENFISYGKEMTPDDLVKTKSLDRLIRSELSLLIGLMVKYPINIQFTSSFIIEQHIETTEKLLEELHESMKIYFWKILKETGIDSHKENPLSRGKSLREPFFYSGESAYIFQYKDFALKKYGNDEKWFFENKGFIPKDVSKVIDVISDIQVRNLNELRSECTIENIDTLTLLPVFTFSSEEVSEKTGYSHNTIENILKASSLKSIPCNHSFTEVGSFNEVNSYPIIPIGNGKYILFQIYSFAEAFYETPFFWMLQDKEYAEKAKENRGFFTEKFSADRLRNVLGTKRVYENVYILNSKGQRAGEIDVLAVFADRAVVLQAKSKKLTEAARKGSDDAIRTDFRKAVQHAYDQGFRCAELLDDKTYRLTDEQGNVLNIRRDFTEVFIFCVVSEYYPALAYQASQFLERYPHKIISPPYVMDVFFLDVLCEILDSPLHFFNFLHRRLTYSEKLKTDSELAVLSFHLVHNLWVEDGYDFFCIGDEVSVDIDAAMLARREGIPGKRTPEGILTKLEGSFFDYIIKQISYVEQDNLLELGYFLLGSSQKSSEDFSKACELIIEETKNDGKPHDFSIAIGSAGITVHSSYFSSDVVYKRLYAHCAARKYSQKAPRWYGLALNPAKGGLIQLAVGLNDPWEKSEEMEQFLERFPSTTPHKNLTLALRQYKSKAKRKIGRNEPCPCGSGKKYKKCCLH